MLDDALLSHGETPHYHRRSAVSLLSSEWDQVVPTLYLRQAIRFVPLALTHARHTRPIDLLFLDCVHGWTYTRICLYKSRAKFKSVSQ
jgi:hypothetical protein